MSETEDVVRGLFGAVSRLDPDELCSYFAPDAVFVNGTSFTLRGRTELRGFFEELHRRVTRCEFEVVNLAVAGDVVLTERIDRVVVDGRAIELPVMGALEVLDGRVAAWRDYFDHAVSGFQREAPGELIVDGHTAVLSGLRVLDLSTHATGPFATQILASLGATVLKVERPPAGDPERRGEYAMFLACNRGKYSIALDVKNAAERQVLEDLAREADAFVEGFRPGVAERMGFGFERLRQLAPRVIYVSLPGFGSTGPRAGLRGYDTQYRALAGDLWLNAGPDGIPRYNPASPSFDYATAMYAAIGVLSALLGPREAAVHLEVPILAAGLAWSFARLIDPAYADGTMASATYVFRTLDDQFVAINAGPDQEFRALCEAIGRPDVYRREDLRDAARRRGRRAEIEAIVADAIAGETLAHWQERLGACDVPHAPVLKPGQVTGDPQVAELGVVFGGDEPHAELPIFGLPRRSLRRVPAVDEHGTLARHGGWPALEREDVA